MASDSKVKKANKFRGSLDYVAVTIFLVWRGRAGKAKKTGKFVPLNYAVKTRLKS